MILLLGKPPYSQRDGSNPSENIKNQNFSFPLRGSSSCKTPKGQWVDLWNHMTLNLQGAFIETFKNNNRLATSDWLRLLEAYKWSIQKEYKTDHILPIHHQPSNIKSNRNEPKAYWQTDQHPPRSPNNRDSSQQTQQVSQTTQTPKGTSNSTDGCMKIIALIFGFLLVCSILRNCVSW